MKYLLGLLIVFTAMTSIQAEFIIKPDDNTLWLENGKNIKVGTPFDNKEWRSGITVESSPKGGFSLGWISDNKRNGGRYVPVSPEYPYLIFEISGMDLINHGFMGFAVSLGKDSIKMSGVINPGIYQLHIDRISGYSFLRYSVYGIKLHINEMKMVKKPEALIEINHSKQINPHVISAGDSLYFTVTLDKPAEAISIRLVKAVNSVTIPLNMMDKIDLATKDGRHWGGKINIKKIGSQKSYRKDSVYIKATLFGCELKSPIWTNIPNNSTLKMEKNK